MLSQPAVKPAFAVAGLGALISRDAGWPAGSSRWGSPDLGEGPTLELIDPQNPVDLLLGQRAVAAGGRHDKVADELDLGPEVGIGDLRV
jgi:hypothetical protein